MAFVPEFEHDVFISYSQVDDEDVLYGGEKVAWVKSLKERLETRVRQRGIGRDLRVWLDTKNLSGNEALSSTLFETVKRSAVLVIIFSENYLQSEWCRKEREIFLEAAANDPRFEGRVFVVHYQDVPLNDRPEGIRDFIGFQFYDKDSSAELDPRGDGYTRALLNLREKIAAKLKEMRKSIEGGAMISSDNRPAVFLAESTPDLHAARTEVQTFIDKLGFRVLPEKLYNRSAGEFRSAAEEDMKKNCKLFVQWLGPFASFRTDDLPEGYEGMQLEVAQTTQLQALRAYQRDAIDFDSVVDLTHRVFLEADDVMALDLEEFKKRIEKTLNEIVLREQTPEPSGADDGDEATKSILITVCSSDREAALKIKERLAEKHRFGFEIIDDSETFEKLTKFYEFDGLVVVFGEEASDDVVADWMRSCAFYRLEKSPSEPACAVYLDPGGNAKRLLSDPPFFNKIGSQEGEAELASFVAEVERRRKT